MTNPMVRIEHYTDDRIADPEGNVPLRTFHKVRNAVVRACKSHGPTGPMGLFPFGKVPGDASDVFTAWGKTADSDPVYFVLDDQLNHERYQYVECLNPDHFTEAWIRDLMAALVGFRGWGIGIKNIPGGYILVFADRLMVTGHCFEGVNDLSSLIESARDALASEG